MHRRKWGESGVSEVIGTILILGMTVVLFSSIILWVTNFPTPQASLRTEMDGTMTGIFKPDGSWNGVNITVQHRGGEALLDWSTQIYLTVERGSSVYNDLLHTKGTETGITYGLIDGSDANWDVGERWTYTNYTILATDRVTLTVVDASRSLLAWSEILTLAAGSHPPVFLEKWTDRNPQTPTLETPQTGKTFAIFAKVTDPDGDLKKDSVYVYLAFLYGTPELRAPQKMFDDGTNGDATAGDGIYTAAYPFFKPSSLSWDGGVILFNATDLKGHRGESRMVLSVEEGPPVTKKTPGGIGSGRPPNLNYNGLQGFGIFNGTSWDEDGFNATETRTFKESEEVVVIVGSAILTDTFGRNKFTLYDPFSSLPLTPVVYGNNKQVTPTSIPSSTEAFQFLMFDNGYNVWIYRFELNNASSVGINFAKTPTRPPQYFFGSYPLEIDMIDFGGNRFYTSDTITITANDGTVRNYPALLTYNDAAYTHRTNAFNSTDVVYVAITMKTVEAGTNVIMGNVVIQDYLGGLPVFRAPKNGHDANPPICPPNAGTCLNSPAPLAVNPNSGTVTYRFSLNLTLANQDPWVDGTQHYALRVMSIRDTDEEYSLVLSAQLVISAPLYRMDIIAGVGDTADNSWGTHDASYYWLNVNGVDKWQKQRLDNSFTKTIDYTKAISYLDYNGDGKLDAVASVTGGSPAAAHIYLYRQDSDQFGNIVWTRTEIENTGNVLVNDIRTGSLDKDTAPEIVVGGSNGQVWYYKNDGSWTKVVIDTSRTAAVEAVDLGDFNGDGWKDIVVGRDGGTLTYYPNLDGNGKFTTSQQTDQWTAEYEQTVTGTHTGTYQDTIAQDGVYETLKEASVTLPQVSGSTLNADFNNPNTDGGNADNWTFSGWTGYNPASATGHKHTTGGNPTHDYSIHMACVKSGQVGGFIDQTFTVTVPSVTATFNLDYKVLSWGATASSMTIYSFLETASGSPTPGTNQVWSVTLGTGTGTNWGTTPMANVDVSARVATPGTYHLKIGAITTDSNSNCGTETVLLLDNAKVFWNRPSGPSSQLIHYYRIQQLPNRPGSTYTLYVRANRPTNSDGDNFVFGYSTTGQFGAYTNTTIIVNSATDTTYSFQLPSLPGSVVWIRVLDTDLTVNHANLDTVAIDRMYIEVYTPGGVTGSDLTVSGGSNIVALDAGDYNGDGKDDVILGTAAGNLWRATGSPGGLYFNPNGYWVTGLGTIGGIKIGNFTTAYAGLEVAVATGTQVRVYRTDTNPGTLISTTTAVPNGKQITTLAAGDVDGNGNDDVVVGTDGGSTPANLVYYRNTPAGWVAYLIDNVIMNRIYDIDLGDISKAQYLGR